MARSNPHQPTSRDNYVHVHFSHMDDLIASGIVVDSDCDFTYFEDSTRLDGTIKCQGDIRIEVGKLLEHLGGNGGKALVLTKEFSYHADR